MATTTWQIVAVVMTEAVALLLLLGGIAVVIAQSGEADVIEGLLSELRDEIYEGDDSDHHC
jgi:hypothetical protein